jgi:hypothetical protein
MTRSGRALPRLLAALVVAALAGAARGDSIRCDGGIVSTGDSKQRFLQFVTLETGRVLSVGRGSYGYALEPPKKPPRGLGLARCDQLAFHLGDSTFDVLSRCGEPALREEKQVTSSAYGPDGAGPAVGGSAGTTLEVWTYDLGPRSFIRHLELEGGPLVRIETGGYGYNPP